MRVMMGKKIRQRLTTAEGRQEMALKVHKKIQQQRMKFIVDGEKTSVTQKKTACRSLVPNL